ncbi:hypothetical protein IC575_009513 [Cucumis melo]
MVSNVTPVHGRLSLQAKRTGVEVLTSRTVILDTHAFVSSRPSPPMLIPWPGPQLTLWI